MRLNQVSREEGVESLSDQPPPQREEISIGTVLFASR